MLKAMEVYTLSSKDAFVTISVDLKKSRIRIHRDTLHILGNPKYIQLLVDPEKMNVAVKAVDASIPGDQIHTVYQRIILSDNSYEIYSKAFIKKLYEINSELDPKYSYRMSGKVLAAHRVAVFSMKTLKQIVVSNGG